MERHNFGNSYSIFSGFLSSFTQENNPTLTQQISLGINIMWIGGILGVIGLIWSLLTIGHKTKS